MGKAMRRMLKRKGSECSVDQLIDRINATRKIQVISTLHG